MALPIGAMVIGGFATLTFLTKNSFLEEIHKQYVLTARAKGLVERRVLYGHVFRNAMLIVIAGFPAAFIGVLFTGSLLIEVIFSLDGIGLLGFEAALNRDYPIMFGTLYFFGLIGLRHGDPGRHHVHAGRSADRLRGARLMNPMNRRRLAAFRSSKRGMISLVDLRPAVLRVAVRRAAGQQQADPHPLRRRLLLAAGHATIPRRPSAATSRPTPSTPTRKCRS